MIPGDIAVLTGASATEAAPAPVKPSTPDVPGELSMTDLSKLLGIPEVVLELWRAERRFPTFDSPRGLRLRRDDLAAVFRGMPRWDERSLRFDARRIVSGGGERFPMAATPGRPGRGD